MFAIKFERCKKSTEIWHVFEPPFFWGGGAPPSPKHLDVHYKIQPVFDHVAKFHGDRWRDLRERVAKKKHLL